MKAFFRTPARIQQYRLAVCDLLGIIINIMLCTWILMPMGFGPEAYSEYGREITVYTNIWSAVEFGYDFALFSIFFCAVYLSVFYIGGLYDIELAFDRKRTFIRLGAATFLGALIIYILLVIFMKNIYSKYVWIFHLCSLFLILLMLKYFLFKKIKMTNPFKILILGNERLSVKAIESISQRAEKKFFSVNFCNENDYFNKEVSPEYGNGYDMIVYPFNRKLSEKHLVSLVKKKFDGITVCSSLELFKFINGKFPVIDLDANSVMNLSTSIALGNRVQKRIKRTIDIYASLFLLIITLPLLMLVSILIKLTSKGPVLYVHERIGLHGKPFRLYKLRTMIDNAEENTGPVWAQKEDPRVTPVGRILRKVWVDELPQLYNVLKGDMSFIGPRPIRKVFEDRFAESIPYYFIRHLVKPGITGWSQVSDVDARAEDGPLRRFEYDIFYVLEYSLLFDAVILLKTIQKVLRAKGR